MAALLGAVFLVGAATALVLALGTGARLRRALDVSRRALAGLGDPHADDDAKEALARRHAAAMFRIFLETVAVMVVAVLTPLAVLWGLDRLGVVSLGAVLETTLSPAFLAACAAAGLVMLLVWRRARRLPVAAE